MSVLSGAMCGAVWNTDEGNWAAKLMVQVIAGCTPFATLYTQSYLEDLWSQWVKLYHNGLLYSLHPTKSNMSCCG